MEMVIKKVRCGKAKSEAQKSQGSEMQGPRQGILRARPLARIGLALDWRRPGLTCGGPPVPLEMP